MKKFWILALTVLMLLSVMQIVERQLSLSQKLVRLHVVANSDTAEDQQIKLLVRDAVLDQVQTLTEDCANQDQTVQVLQAHLPELEQTAASTLRQLGSRDAVHITLGPERFPTRYYDTFTLPAGQYTSLRVELGQGTGRNWWCVAFPTLCTAAQAQDMQAIAADYGFTEQEIAMITEPGAYQVDFKLLELLERVVALFA